MRVDISLTLTLRGTLRSAGRTRPLDIPFEKGEFFKFFYFYYIVQSQTSYSMKVQEIMDISMKSTIIIMNILTSSLITLIIN